MICTAYIMIFFSLRLKRIQPPQETCGKEKKLKHKKANKGIDHQRIKKILKKAKGSKNSKRKRRHSGTQELNSREEAKEDLTDAAEAQSKHELVMLDDEDEEDSTRKQIPQKTAGRRKVTQTLLKPLVPKGAKERLKKKGLVQKSLMKPESEKNDVQRRPPRRAAAAAAKNYIEADENDEIKKPNKTYKKTVSNKGMSGICLHITQDTHFYHILHNPLHWLYLHLLCQIFSLQYCIV